MIWFIFINLNIITLNVGSIIMTFVFDWTSLLFMGLEIHVPCTWLGI